VLGAAAVAFACATAPAATAQAPERATIAYALRVGGGHSEVFLVRSDGSGRTRLTGGDVPLARAAPSSSEPAWSPDGTRLAFDWSEDDDSTSGIRTMDIGTGESRTLTGGHFDFGPAWSADGARIAFSRSSEHHGNSIFAVQTGGGAKPVQLTKGSRFKLDIEPAWSPDGTMLAFTRFTFHVKAERVDTDLFVADADGGGAHRLAADAQGPAWSPDGTRIAFLSTRDRQGETCFEECAYNNELYVMPADGSAQRRLTYTNGDERDASWSPDGLRIAFDSDRNSPEGTDGGGRELYSIGADGHCMTWLTNGGGDSTAPAWRPGSGAATDPGPGCGATPRAPTYDFDVSALRSFHHHPLYWLGPQFGNALLSYLDGNDPFYTDCASYRASDCAQRIEMQNESICRRHPFAYGGGRGGGETGADFFEDESTLASSRFAYRGAIAAAYQSAEGWDVYTGRTTVVVFGVGPRPRDVKPVIRALRRMPGGRGGDGSRRLPAPAFPDDFWRKLKRFERTYRRLGSEAAAGKELRVTPHAVHDKLALGRLLRRQGVKRHARC
jgi:hypothetical protein